MHHDDITELGQNIISLSAYIAAATQQLLDMIRSFDLAEGWKADGCLSCVDWLTRHTGVATATAYEHLRVAHRLGELPLVDQAFAEGRLSYTKVRAMTRVATPMTEEKLVAHALTSTGEEMERRCRAQRDADVALDRAEPARYLSRRSMGDGTVELRIRLDAAEAELVMKAVEEIRSADFSAEESAGDEPRSKEAQQVDAFMHLIHTWAEGSSDGQRRSSRPEIIVRVDVSALGDDARLEDSNTWLSREALDRLTCDAAVAVVTTDGERILDAGRSRRTVPPAMARALIIRDEHCVYPGCTNHRWLEAHHIVHWSQGGETSMDNLCLLCTSHHRLEHQGAFRIDNTGGTLRFYTADGAEVAAPTSAPIRHDPVWLLQQLNPDLPA